MEKRLFDAWGNVLVQNGTGTTLNGLTLLDRGYTGHEHLQSVGLIHMNGRLYDPKLHRFLQPDNFVQEPYNTQNYNRYGYCWNNPLKYTDASGEWINIVIGAVIGGVVNWAMHGCQFNAKGALAFGIGAAGGALIGMGNTAGLSFFAAGAQTAALAVAGTMVTNVGNHIAFGDPLMSGKDLLITAGVSFVTGGLLRAPRVPVSTVSELTPAGMVGVQAENAITATAGPTTIANIASEAALDTSKELANVGITTVKNLEGQFSFTAVNQLDDVVVTTGKSSGNIWSSTKSLSSVANAFSHFKKHALEFPEFNNALEYVKGAKYFMTNEVSGELTMLRQNGDLLKYHPQTNTFGVMNSAGEVKTMFRPVEGMKYWLSLINK